MRLRDFLVKDRMLFENKFSKYILSFDQASIENGGEGAFYVYLRKKKN